MIFLQLDMSYPGWPYIEAPYPTTRSNFTIPSLPSTFHPPHSQWADGSYTTTPLVEIDPYTMSEPLLPPRARRRSTKSKQLIKTRPPVLSTLSTNTTHPNNVPTSPTSPEIPDIRLKGQTGPLLPVPPGCNLEVNNLLILIPPTVSPRSPSRATPLNQYSNPGPAEQHRSQYEMYTCRACSKTYDGRNARSVARRHLQDRHGVPLAMQKRRTRWDSG